jgi:2-aminoadipate transaminase
LPNPQTFPLTALAEAAQYVMGEEGTSALQYRTTEGHAPLRAYIAERYRQRYGMQVTPEQILITSGSQQAQDLTGKVFLNAGDRVVLERPSYLGAIQAFSIYEPSFIDVSLVEAGIDCTELAEVLSEHDTTKLLYIVPNFQNPTGISYTLSTRHAVAELVRSHDTLLVEDDPYGELRFEGDFLPPIAAFAPERTIHLGSFSKIIAPGLRLGWLCAPCEIIEQLTIAKQAADLHSNALGQYIIARYLCDHDLNAHIESIRNRYRAQRDCMLTLLARYCPPTVSYTHPQGGMFLWMTLPKGMQALDLFNLAMEENVAFVPGDPFYLNGRGAPTLRLNFTNADPEAMEEGIIRLTRAIRRLMERAADAHALHV